MEEKKNSAEEMKAKQLLILKQNATSRIGVLNVAVNDYIKSVNDIVGYLETENMSLKAKLKKQ